MDRRRCLHVTGLGAVAAAGAGKHGLSAEARAGEPAGRAAAPRPDILLIMPDQMRGDCLSALGHPAVRTPNLDALVRQGAAFTQAYTTVPSCIPARHSLLTGLFPQTSGVVGFRVRPIRWPTLPQRLGEAGYGTVLVGRYMHQTPAKEPYGYERMILGSTHVDNDDYDHYLRKTVPESGGIRKLVGSLEITYNGWRANPWPLDHGLHPTEWIVAQARKVVADGPADRPLFLTASFYAPHPPLFPPKPYFDRVLKRTLPAPAHGDWVAWDTLTPKGDRAGHRVLLQGEMLRRAQAGYYGLIEHLDDQIAPLVAEFTARSRKAGRPWVVLVTSDHGEMMGDHGYYRKCEPYEGSARIPFIVAGSPNLGFRAGLRTREPVALEDIMPTLLALAGTACPEMVDGVDLGPVLRGEKAEVRPWLHFEHAPCYSKAQAFHALTDGRHKYIWRPTDGGEQLFNLETDPREEHDLAGDAAHAALLEQWRARMIQRLANRPEGFSDGTHLIAGRPYPPLQAL